jgi:hypothetical protein
MAFVKRRDSPGNVAADTVWQLMENIKRAKFVQNPAKSLVRKAGSP